MSKVIFYYWYTLKATVIISYVLFYVWERITAVRATRVIEVLVFRKAGTRIKLIFIRIVNFFIREVCRYIPWLNNYATTLTIRNKFNRAEYKNREQLKHAAEEMPYITKRLKESYPAARYLIKFIRDSKKPNCAYMSASWAAQESRAALGTYIPGLIGMIWICEKDGDGF